MVNYRNVTWGIPRLKGDRLYIYLSTGFLAALGVTVSINERTRHQMATNRILRH